MVDLTMLQKQIKKEQEKNARLEQQLKSLKNHIKMGKILIISIMVMLAILIGVICILLKCMNVQIPYIYSTTIECGIVIEVLFFCIYYYFNTNK